MSDECGFWNVALYSKLSGQQSLYFYYYFLGGDVLECSLNKFILKSLLIA